MSIEARIHEGRRTYFDGKPYYCKMCGLGLGEYMACEEPECELESEEDAAARADRLSDTRN